MSTKTANFWEKIFNKTKVIQLLENQLYKKAKYQQPRRPLSASVQKNGQGKITAYLPEMKHFIALRKEKLDRVLNLATPKVEQPQQLNNGLEGLNEVTMQDISKTTENGKKDTTQLVRF